LIFPHGHYGARHFGHQPLQTAFDDLLIRLAQLRHDHAGQTDLALVSGGTDQQLCSESVARSGVDLPLLLKIWRIAFKFKCSQKPEREGTDAAKDASNLLIVGRASRHRLEEPSQND